MKVHSSYPAGCSVYPGEYRLLSDTEECLDRMKQTGGQAVAKPLITEDEVTACYTLEVAIPGARREEIIIRAEENMLSIKVIHQPVLHAENKERQEQEYEHAFFDWSFHLPEEADSEFISAEYRDGILHLHFPKSRGQAAKNNNRIVVY